jgi:hypothetical protein
VETLLFLLVAGMVFLLVVRTSGALNAGRVPPHEVGARMRAAWQHLARRFGLVDHPPGFEFQEESLESRGTIEGFPAVLRTRQDSWTFRRAVLDLRVTLDPGLPSDVAIRLRRPYDKRVSPGQVTTGDPVFDEAVVVRGDPTVLVPLLDAETRGALAKLCAAGGEIADATLTIDSRIPADDVAQVKAAVLEAIAVAQRLRPGTDTVERLARNALADPEPAVRRLNLELVGRLVSRGDTVASTARAAMVDLDARVRLTAALLLGTEGRPVLLALAGAPATPTDVGLEAIDALGSECPADLALRHLERALGTGHLAPVEVALRALGRGSTDTGRAKLEALVLDRRRPIAAAAARALGLGANAASEDALLAALQRPGRDVRLAAATALGAIGSIAAVLALQECAEQAGLASPLRREALQAIASIQERATGSAPGQLALADLPGGEISLVATSDAGTLSIATPEEAGSHPAHPGKREPA